MSWVIDNYKHAVIDGELCNELNKDKSWLQVKKERIIKKGFPIEAINLPAFDKLYNERLNDYIYIEPENDLKTDIEDFEQSLIENNKHIDWINKYIETNNIYKSIEAIERKETFKYYVYALINYKNGEIFYIGKGKGLRLLDHEKNQSDSNKKKYIDEIGTENIHYWIIENYLEQGMAYSLESYLINKLPNLTNVIKTNITFEYPIYLDYLKLLSNYER
jgi:hypothetical protein